MYEKGILQVIAETFRKCANELPQNELDKDDIEYKK